MVRRRSCISRRRGPRPLNRRSVPRDQRMTNWQWHQGMAEVSDRFTLSSTSSRPLYDHDRPPVDPYLWSVRPSSGGAADSRGKRRGFTVRGLLVRLCICPDVLPSSRGSLQLSSLGRFMRAASRQSRARRVAFAPEDRRPTICYEITTHKTT